MNEMKKERVVSCDYLRVAAIAAVILLHTATQSWGGYPGRSFEWNVLNIYNSISRWGVPVFLMISGSLFLPREADIKKLYSKNILRMIISYVFWSAVYVVALSFCGLHPNPDREVNFKTVIADFVGGPDHMWFIPMIIGLYMCLPILQQIVKKKEISRYFLLLSFVFAFIIPQGLNLVNDFIGGLPAAGAASVGDVVADMKMDLVLGYAFYFILGHELSNAEFTAKQRKIIYLLGAAGFVSTILLNACVSWKTHLPCGTYYGNFNVNIALEAAAVFVWFRSRSFGNEKLNTAAAAASKYCFGAYLVHIIVLNILAKIGLHTAAFSPVISVPAIALLVIAGSFAVSFVLNKIPVVNKWLV